MWFGLLPKTYRHPTQFNYQIWLMTKTTKRKWLLLPLLLLLLLLLYTLTAMTHLESFSSSSPLLVLPFHHSPPPHRRWVVCWSEAFTQKSNFLLIFFCSLIRRLATENFIQQLLKLCLPWSTFGLRWLCGSGGYSCRSGSIHQAIRHGRAFVDRSKSDRSHGRFG